jgi:hypothetical protein
LYYGGQKYYYAITKKKTKRDGKTLFTQTHVNVDGNSVFTILPFKEKKTLPSV